MISESEIDQLLLSFCKTDWQKVAKVIGNTLRRLELCGFQFNDGALADAIDARMDALVGSGRLQAQGNIKNWRYSEVRLPLAVAHESR
jgi:Protein of unknown function